MAPREMVILYFFRAESDRTERRRRSAMSLVFWRFVFGSIMKNSSPPNLATMSYFLTFFARAVRFLEGACLLGCGRRCRLSF